MGKLRRDFSAVTLVGVDLAKNSFQVHGVDAQGGAVFARALKRGAFARFFEELPRCVVAMEACASAHHWGRALSAMGFQVKLVPAAYAKAYVKRNKTDAADAAAICEAASRPSMRFVAVRSIDNQAALMRHRVRELLSGQRTQMLNALRGHMGEMGVVAPQGGKHAYDLKRVAQTGADENGEVLIDDCVREALAPLIRQIDAVDAELAEIDKALAALAKADDAAKRLMTIPGLGPVTATAFAATIRDVAQFPNARAFAGYLGLAPRQDSTGGKPRLGRISKRGDRYLRKLLVVGATAVLRHRAGHADALRRWARDLFERKMVKYKFKLVAVALANKLARIVYALLAAGGVYEARPAAA